MNSETTFWHCWVEGTDGGSHLEHPTFEEAKREAERLAKLPMNKRRVYVMESVAYCEISEPQVTWYETSL